MEVSTRTMKEVTITMNEIEAQELYQAIYPIADNKIKCENYIREGVHKLQLALLQAGFRWIGD